MCKLFASVLCVTTIMLSSTALAEDGITADTITLGQSCALKGPAAALGKGMRDGLNVYFGRVNAAGGIDGRTIQLKSINDGYEPAKAELVTKTLIDKNKVFLLIGEVGTPTSKVAVPIAEAANVPFVGPFTGAEFLRNPYKEQVVNLRGSYFQEMERLAQYLVDEKGLQKIACFYQNDGYGKAGLKGIELALERRGLQLASTGTYERNTVAVSQGLASVAAARPQAVISVGAYKPCAAFIKAAKANSAVKDAIFCNISFVGTKALLKELGAAGEGCVVSQVVPYPWDTSIGVISQYHADMKQAGLESEIGFITLEGYLVGKLFCMTMERIDGEPSRAAFIETVGKIGTYDLGGITLAFGPDDHQGMDKVFLTQFQGGKIKPLVGVAD